MRTVALRWIFTLRRECRTSGWRAKQTCSDGAQQRRSTGLTGLNWTMTQIANSLQVLERIGGDDGTRTRGLCRDSLGIHVLSATYLLAGAAKSLKRTVGTVACG